MPQTAREETSLKYRPDIDGLRAVAVLSVLAYHIGLPLHGGFVGVDIFFTISGFLIGSIILRQTAECRFTFAGFYERRIRRIFPALFVMLFVSSIVAYKYLLPLELIDFAKSLSAASFSVSNIYFWLQSGYFDAPASSKLLLHTWSLAVEEQFYLLLPVLLVLLRRHLPRRVDLAIYLLTAISLLISAYGAFRDPSTTFYWTHTRAWELLLGTILALESCPRIRHAAWRHAAGIAGLILLCAALLFYRTWTPFPGLAAIPPCLGAALIISAGRSGPHLVGRILSFKPIVFIGLISYSLYLWHWPIIVYEKLGFTLFNGLSKHQNQTFLCVVSIVVAVLSWRFVEVPFRTGALRMNRLVLFRGAAVAMGAATILSIGMVASRGMEFRFPPRAREIALYIDNDPHDHRDAYRNGTCFITSQTATLADFKVDTCLPEKLGEKKLLVLGDSHGAALWWGLSQVFQGVNVMQATASGCKPVLHQRPRQFASCIAVMDYALKVYLPSHRVDAVLIEAHWDDGDIPSIGETLAWLRERKIPTILFGPIAQYDSSLPRLLALSVSQNDPLLPSRHHMRFVEPLDRQMESLARESWHVPYISLFRLFCAEQPCTEYAAPDVPLLSDYGHLTKSGSILAAEKIEALRVLPLDLPHN